MERTEPTYTVELTHARDRNRYGVFPGGIVHQGNGRELAEAIAHMYQARGAACTISTATKRHDLRWWMKL